MINLAKVVVKTPRTKKVKQPVEFTLFARDVQTPRIATATLEPIFYCGKNKPSPKAITFHVPGTHRVEVWRELNKGFSARWYVKDTITNKTYEGTKGEVRVEAGARIALAYRKQFSCKQNQ